MVDLNPKLYDQDIEQIPTRDGYGEGLIALGKSTPQVVVLTGDLAESTRVLDFAKLYPDRFLECGVAEQNMTGVAVGLALGGKIPFISSYAVFSPGRSWDQARVSICYSNTNVKIAGAHTGVSVGPDGATHQALEDIAITRVLPNMTVIVPCDVHETKKTTLAAAQIPGPVYFRFARYETPVITTPNTPFKPGQAEIFHHTSKNKVAAAIVACGPLVYQSLLAARKLEEQGLGIIVVNNHTIKPIDHKTLCGVAQSAGAVVCVEEHQIMGGMGSAVAESLAQNYPVPMEFVGMQDTFGESGQPPELLEKYKMTADAICGAVIKVTARKKHV